MRTRPSGAARVVSARIRSAPSRPLYGMLANDAVRGSRAAIKRNRIKRRRANEAVHTKFGWSATWLIGGPHPSGV
eukprot:scaffold8936_cov61-Phaeocystis_antarctica.AAC.1